jgi:hypothetical protein
MKYGLAGRVFAGMARSLKMECAINVGGPKVLPIIGFQADPDSRLSNPLPFPAKQYP